MNPLNVLKIYFNRYYRLTPLLVFIMYFSAFVIYPLASGPARTTLYERDIEACASFGWYNILYVNNYFDDALKCFGWCWYLANDMQMFLLLPWILMFYKLLSMLGILIMVGLFLIHYITTFVLTYHYETSPSNLFPDPHYNDYYGKPWTRIGPYLIGIVFAMMYENFKDGVKYDK